MVITIEQLRAIAGAKLQKRLDRQARRKAIHEEAAKRLWAAPVDDWFMVYEQQMMMAAVRGEFGVDLVFTGRHAEIKRQLAERHLNKHNFFNTERASTASFESPQSGRCVLHVEWKALG